jgi:hypothetical protein
LDWARRSYQANRAYDNTVRLMAIEYACAGEEFLEASQRQSS